MNPTPDLRERLAREPGVGVRVISPHLDDAVYSTHALLTLAGVACEVVTVFTEAAADADSSWARQTGFADARAEHAARRAEDEAVLARLGVAGHHAGLSPAQWPDVDTTGPDDRRLQGASRLLAGDLWPGSALRRVPGPGGRPWLLLPAAAGGVLGAWQQRLRRLRRVPFGAPVHPEHQAVRDALVQAWARSPEWRARWRLGFYAELPYVWNEPLAALDRRLGALAGVPLQRYRLAVSPAAKHAAAAGYASQLAPILSPDPAYQRRVLARDEAYWLAEDAFDDPRR